MPNYLVNHLLLGPGPAPNKDGAAPTATGERKKFMPGEIVTEKELTDAGFDLDWLRTKKGPMFSPAIIAQAQPGETVAPPPAPPPATDKP